MFEVDIRANGWTAHFGLRRATTTEEVMDWNERAKKRTEERKKYVDSLKKAGKLRTLLLFYLPDCFDVISKTMRAEIATCDYVDEIKQGYHDQTMSAEITKDGYPRASLTILLQTSANPESCNAIILCKTKGLGINNESSETLERYNISVDDGGNITYHKLGTSGGITGPELGLVELVDSILGPFADCLAT